MVRYGRIDQKFVFFYYSNSKNWHLDHMIIKKYSLKETMFNLIKIIIILILTYSQTSKEVFENSSTE